MADNIQTTLDEREEKYGSWKNHSQISYDIQTAIAEGWNNRTQASEIKGLPPYMTESLTMIATKIGRIVNGDPFYDDSWRDIAGYATLVVNELAKSHSGDSQSEVTNELNKTQGANNATSTL